MESSDSQSLHRLNDGEMGMLDFAYSYSGSLGFVFSVPNDRMLVGESLFDMAMGAFMDLPRVESSESVSIFAKKYGTAPVRLAFQWAQAHLGADRKSVV